jgi:hypothetical protein
MVKHEITTGCSDILVTGTGLWLPVPKENLGVEMAQNRDKRTGPNDITYTQSNPVSNYCEGFIFPQIEDIIYIHNMPK